MVEYPYIVYCDFEVLLNKVEEQRTNKTFVYQKHIPCGYSIVIVDNENNVIYKNIFRGKDTAKCFLKDLKEQTEIIMEKQLKIKEMNPLTFEEEQEFLNAEVCSICKKPFLNKSDNSEFVEIKVKDHDHITGKYRGASHNSCNINYSMPKKIPVLFHNLKGYDSHIIIDALSIHEFSKCEIIPQTFEKYISFTLNDAKVLDSYQFMPDSLKNLVNNLNNSNYDFPITKQIFSSVKNLSQNYFKLLIQKQIYPYEYMDNFDKFEEEKLPSREEFYSTLNYEQISEDDYKHACKIWNIFQIKNLGEYHDLYVLLDTCLLADVFQVFRKTILSRYELDPCHFYSAPGLAWAAALKKTDARLELITDINMYQFIENGIRGGICQVSKRFCKANNKYMDNYNDKKESKYIAYLDGK